MSRRVELPNDRHVLETRDALLAEAASAGRRATVVELARRIGLSNTTFWRHYPSVAAELAHAARQTPRTDGGTTGHSPAREKDSPLAELRRDNRALREHLDLAAASIARLTLENQRLRQELEDAHGVQALRPAHRDDGRSARPTDVNLS